MSLGSNQIDKKSKYIFEKLSDIENYKKRIREMIFALKDLGLWRYIDGTIIKLVFIAVKEKEPTMTIFAKAKQEI